jgi:hypothetical protein
MAKTEQEYRAELVAAMELLGKAKTKFRMKGNTVASDGPPDFLNCCEAINWCCLKTFHEITKYPANWLHLDEASLPSAADVYHLRFSETDDPRPGDIVVYAQPNDSPYLKFLFHVMMYMGGSRSGCPADGRVMGSCPGPTSNDEEGGVCSHDAVDYSRNWTTERQWKFCTFIRMPTDPDWRAAYALKRVDNRANEPTFKPLCPPHGTTRPGP